MPTANKIPPAPLKITCIGLASSGLTKEIIIKRNIPTPRERQMASQDFCLLITLIIKNIETKIETRKTFDIIQQIKLKRLNPTISNESFETPPPIKEPSIKAKIMQAPPTKHTRVFEIT